MLARPQGAGVDRRQLLLGGLAAASVSHAAGAADSEPALIVRDTQATNLESPFADLREFITPTRLFYVRNHFAQPKIEATKWSLSVEGEVERRRELSLDDLKKLPTRTQISLLECAGNGRVFLVPRQAGLQWANGAVSVAEWTGVPLREVLKQAGIRPGAVEVIVEGADRGEVRDEPRSPGEVTFSRSLPLSVAQREDVLLAFRMNGADLTPEHGYPVRLVVPNWYGMASIKWVIRMIVTREPFDGFFQTMQYAYWKRINGVPTLTPVGEIDVKSAIARPRPFEELPAGSRHKIIGAAWSGAGPIAGVEVTADGGKTWSPARLVGRTAPGAWRFWEFDWSVPKTAGTHVLQSRARDAAGRVQPMERDPDRRSTMISHAVPVPVRVI